MRATKADAIRKALANGPLLMEELQPLVENALEQVVGRAKLYAMLATMRGIDITGRAKTRTYALAPK